MKAISTAKAVGRGLRSFALENTLELLPLRHRLRGYGISMLRRDATAGLNVALLSVGQGLAFAQMAGLPPSYGLTCAGVASCIGPLLASSRHTILGPTNATAFLIFSAFGGYTAADKLELLPAIIFAVGVILVMGAYLRLADLVQYISRTVVVGYLAGSALLIVVNQFKNMAALHLAALTGRKARTFATELVGVIQNIGHSHWPSLLLGAGTFALYWGLRRYAPKWPGFALVLVVTAAVVAALHAWTPLRFETLQAFSSHDLLPVVPDFRQPGLWDRLSPLMGVSLALAFLAAMENSVMAKSLAARTGDRVDLNQEMLSIGGANLACSLLSGMPCSGSLTRSALNWASGAVTQISSLFAGVLCLVGAFTLGPWLAHVPTAALAALVISVALSLIQRRQLRMCLRATRSDAMTLGITLVATLLLPLQIAIFVGVGASIVFYLRKAARPQLVEYAFNPRGDLTAAPEGGRSHPSISIVHVEGELFFGAAELFRTQIQRLAVDPDLRVVILRLKNARHLDATSVMALEELIYFMRSRGRHLLVSGAMKDVYRVLKNSGLVEILGRENVFPGSIQNPNLSTRNALKRAQELLGTKDAEVRIFYDPAYGK